MQEPVDNPQTIPEEPVESPQAASEGPVESPQAVSEEPASNVQAASEGPTGKGWISKRTVVSLVVSALLTVAVIAATAVFGDDKLLRRTSFNINSLALFSFYHLHRRFRNVDWALIGTVFAIKDNIDNSRSVLHFLDRSNYAVCLAWNH